MSIAWTRRQDLDDDVRRYANQRVGHRWQVRRKVHGDVRLTAASWRYRDLHLGAERDTSPPDRPRAKHSQESRDDELMEDCGHLLSLDPAVDELTRLVLVELRPLVHAQKPRGHPAAHR